jgi:2-keto-3-deoxy-L-rhamnonate aldolase RhmA
VDNNFIDMVYIGTYDIASSLGCSVEDKQVLNELERCAKIIKKYNKSVGCLYHNKKELNFFQSIGVNFLVYGVDSRILYNEYSKIKSNG